MIDNQFMKTSIELEVISRCNQNQAKSYNKTDSMVWCTWGWENVSAWVIDGTPRQHISKEECLLLYVTGPEVFLTHQLDNLMYIEIVCLQEQKLLKYSI